jgi:hypothetical protein
MSYIAVRNLETAGGAKGTRLRPDTQHRDYAEAGKRHKCTSKKEKVKSKK